MFNLFHNMFKEKVLLAIGRLVSDLDLIYKRLNALESDAGKSPHYHLQERLLHFGELRFIPGDQFIRPNREGIWTLALNNHGWPSTGKTSVHLVFGKHIEDVGSLEESHLGIPAAMVIRSMAKGYKVIWNTNLG